MMLSRLISRRSRVLVRAFSSSSSSSSSYDHKAVFQSNIHANGPQEWKQLAGPEAVTTTSINGVDYLNVSGDSMRQLSKEAFSDIAHLLRPAHLQQLRNILDDAEASPNDKFVAMELLNNANIASNRILPGCQDTGTAIVMGKKGHQVLTDGQDEANLAGGAYDAYTQLNLRYSQVAPVDMFTEKNTGNNMPAQVDLYASDDADAYKFMFIAKGGGSANKTFLYQQTKALLNTGSLEAFLEEKIKSIGTSACPPYHLAIVIGGLSAELTLKTVKLASTKYYDDLPTTGDTTGRAFRDVAWEEYILKMTRNLGIGAQFGGKYFCHDIRVVRLPRHGASCPVGIGVSCSADRQVLGKITKDGVFLEKLETDVQQYIPEVTGEALTEDVVSINMNDMTMEELRKRLGEFPVRTRLSLTGTIVVARDIAHARMLEQIKNGEGLPQYAKDHIIYYAGPAKTPKGYASGSFGPTTAGRMDGYVDDFMKEGGSFVTLAKGNRSKAVTKACKKYGGFYLGSIGGPAAILAKNCIKNVEVLDNEEDGMEAVWKIDVENFPAFIVVDDKGEDFFQEWLG
mmetsp:Transcript_1897/g.2958  ORF Transcript_1897/g.2958 Transcript_1897/m.2958 type:complete len:569 (+) Transcript_1897:73-1779(+)|eukprot:CAMPEP_0119004348 /NCGR_PEP_ID=MMETSP1176-20130426/1090_1 /TAXON_ID=265551 /ORGANISM="Synedropsis recta cf, Strain CCMP1620" /LENGTH=568 /DNA_ID=CAMNT_0006956041 /DNA_START=73 /DNA_END=1779 /DNA_ORIENTATION=-